MTLVSALFEEDKGDSPFKLYRDMMEYAMIYRMVTGHLMQTSWSQ